MPHSEGVLVELPLLASLPADQRGLVVECFERRTYEFGAAVVTQGEPADAYYVISSGRARVLQSGADGGEVPLNLLSAGEAFGELALIEQSPRTSTVRASTTLEVLRLDRSVFVALVRLHPELARSVGADVAAVRRGDFLRLHPAFAGLPRPLVTAAVRAMEELRLAPGERFAAPADDRRGLVLVSSGRLAVVDADGAEELPLHAGDVVRLGVRNSSIEARTDASLLRLRGVDRDRLSAGHPEVDARLDERADLVERRRSGDTEVAPQGVRTTPTDEALLAEIAEDDPGSTGRVPGAPRRRRWRRYASVRQIDSMDCGAACVATLCRHFGHDVSLPAIRAAVGTGLDGTSLRGIMDGGAELGLEFRTIKSSIDRLPDLPAPLILHWGGNHWVVLHELRGDKAVLADPATGLRTVSTSQLGEEWSGYAAIPTPTPRLADAPRAGLTLGWLRPLVRPYRGALVLAAMLAFVATALQVALPVLTEVVVDGLLDGDGAARATRTVGWIVLALLGAVGATLVQQRIFARVAVEVDGLALDYIAERMLRLPVGYFQVRRTADIQRRLEGMREVRRVLVEQGVAAATAVFQLLVALVVLFFFSPVLALMFVLVFPAYALLMRYSSSRLKPVFDTLEEAFGRYQGKQLDAIRGIEVVKVSGAEAGFRRTLLREFEGLQDRLYRRDLTLLTYEGLVSLVTLGVVTLFLWVGALLVTAGSMSVGALVASNALILTAIGPLRILLSLWDQLQYAGVLLARLQDVHEQRPEQDPEVTHQPVATVEGHVRLRKVSFHHPHAEHRLVLQDISLDVPAGSTVALVGRSGSGKSTLLRCLAGLLVPTAGTIEYDDQDITDLDLPDLRRHIGFVLQEAFLFDATIKENIAFGHPEADFDRVREAAAIANADGFVEALPLGYETRVGDSGLRLSTGQAQRLAIARAVYDRPTVLLMDEPTSALDTEAERAVKEGIDRLLRGRTAFIVAHRLSTIADADLICVIEDGRLVEQGTHDDLLERGGLYAYLYGQQLAS